MDRYWFLTSTTYGTWLSGNGRGFVGNVWGEEGTSVKHNLPGTPYDEDIPALRRFMQEKLKCPPIFFTPEQAAVLVNQFQETAVYRGWLLLATAVMSWHFHIVVGVEGDPNPSDLLRDFKSYGSRALNCKWGKPASGTWWTESGSKRKLPNSQAVRDSVQYVRDQYQPFVVWSREDPEGERGA